MAGKNVPQWRFKNTQCKRFEYAKVQKQKEQCQTAGTIKEIQRHVEEEPVAYSHSQFRASSLPRIMEVRYKKAVASLAEA